MEKIIRMLYLVALLMFVATICIPKTMAVEIDNTNDFLAKLRMKRDSTCGTCGCLPDCCCTTGCDNCNPTDSCGDFCGCVYNNCFSFYHSYIPLKIQPYYQYQWTLSSS